MVSASQIKLVRSLRHKKYRDLHRLYLAEGEKIVRELVRSHGTTGSGLPGEKVVIRQLFATGSWLNTYRADLEGRGIAISEISPAELEKLSSLVTPQQVMALVSMPDEVMGPGALTGEILLAFESIRDPGNLGTIMRTADWFGIRQIVCSPDSVDVFNPKVVQSTMGAIARVRVHYMDLGELLKQPVMKERPVYGTFLNGESLYETTIGPKPLILFGNESRGVSTHLETLVNRKISIPSFSASADVSESLNLAASVAIVCSEIRRRGL